MAYTNWKNNNSIVQGDITISLEKGRVYRDYIELYLFAYSNKWDTFNAALEYRYHSKDVWKDDLTIISAEVNYIKGDKLYGLQASVGGYLNKIIWKFSDNYIHQGDIPQIRVRFLPSIRQFSKTDNNGILTSAYGVNKVDLIEQCSNYTVIGIDNYGNYIATDSTKLYVLSSIEGAGVKVRQFNGVDNPSHAIQIYSGMYIVADTDNNRVIGLDKTLTNILIELPMLLPQFVSYSEANDTLLVTTRNPDKVYEITWDENTTPNLLWVSDISLNDPSSATYSRNNKDKIVISDTGNNRIVFYDKLDDAYSIMTNAYFRGGDISLENSIEIYKPVRSYQLYDDKICIVEGSGRIIDFDAAESSSSSSSSFGYSSSSSWGYSSSSSGDLVIGEMIIGSTFIVR
ncbi:MAG: hypothetical protein WC119_02120 [Synergistaceae bacterium]